jgi:uncharacterized OB-fold protein
MLGLPPRTIPTSLIYWSAMAREEIYLPNCRTCGRFFFYPRIFCPHCTSRDLTWLPATETASLYTWSVAEVPVSAAFAHLVHPILAVAELHNVHIPTSLVDTPLDQIAIGMPLQPIFDHDTYAGFTLLRFRGISS